MLSRFFRIDTFLFRDKTSPNHTKKRKTTQQQNEENKQTTTGTTHDNTMINSLTVAKFLATLISVNGFMMWTEPEMMLAMYNSPSLPESVHMCKFTAAAMLSCGIPILHLLSGNQDFDTALFIAQIPWMLQYLRSTYINQDQKKMTVPLSNYIIPFFGAWLVVHANFINSSSSSIGMTSGLIFGGFIMLNGISAATNQFNLHPDINLGLVRVHW